MTADLTPSAPGSPTTGALSPAEASAEAREVLDDVLHTNRTGEVWRRPAAPSPEDAVEPDEACLAVCGKRAGCFPEPCRVDFPTSPPAVRTGEPADVAEPKWWHEAFDQGIREGLRRATIGELLDELHHRNPELVAQPADDGEATAATCCGHPADCYGCRSVVGKL